MKKTLNLFLALSLLGVFSIYAHDHKKGEHMMKDHFKKMDTDGDKKISKAEWQKFHDDKFAELDKDGNGSVTEEEMAAHHKTMMEKHPKK